MEEKILHLIQKTATTLPNDIISALAEAKNNEKKNSNADFALETIEKNVVLAEEKNVPLCQDTGFPTFFVERNEEISEKILREKIFSAVEKATELGYLRPNSVDSLTGKNSGNNLGEGFPKIIFSSGNFSETKISLLLKGGGSENVSDQSALPMQTDFGKAGRNIAGVEKAVLQIVKNAQGKGCAPGILGVHIGGDRSSGYEYAKKNFFRMIGERSPNPVLQELEEKILEKGNELEIGAMGFGGKSTLLEVFCSASHRVPASFFVTVSYSCWAMRRNSISIATTQVNNNNSSHHSLSCKHSKISSSSPSLSSDRETEKNAKRISLPMSESDARNLKVGEKILLTGKIFTGRDALHHKVVEEGENLPLDISGSAIYHCGPVMQKNIDETSGKISWKCLSAGPTTSIREEDLQSDFIKKTGIRAVIGKGGMGEKTKKALQDFGAVYLHAIGGAAAVYAEKITAVPNVYYLDEMGVPEAMWEMEVKDFPVIVTMDSH